ncbi:MAG: hypothetical protein MR598_00880 [Erysipelotrichaceae bacterium]|nr:hypothetical protein [Erysipelotrichaceae bacterium]
MIEYANETIMKLLKQYDMLSKSLNFTTDLKQKNDICDQMTKIIQSVLEQTNSIYEAKYTKVSKRSVYLMDEEKTRLLELINLVNERRVYVNNQIVNNKELTGINIEIGSILGEDKLEDYKSQVKIIDKYKNNIKLESILKEEIKNLDISIKKANDKINNNKNLNRQLEDKMIRILDDAFKKLSSYELKEREKEIDLAYTELGYSLEKAKENAKIARRDCAEDIILECDNMLASITLEYERYKEKKLILKLIYLYKEPVNTYEEILNKREEINNILMNITSSELYSMVGNELNKEYATIKLEGQDIATLKSLMEERDNKDQTLKDINIENNSAEFKGLLATLLENEKRYQEKLMIEKKKKEQERLEREKQEEQKKLEEIARRQKALEEERKKEIERRTKQLLVEKKNPVLMPTREEKNKEEPKEIFSKRIETKDKKIETKTNSINFGMKTEVPRERTKVQEEKTRYKESKSDPFENLPSNKKDDFFSREIRNSKILDQGIPVIKNNNLDNKVVTAKKLDENPKKVFPDIPLEKKETIFPDLPDTNKNNSFFDENEFNDLSKYMENDKKTSWF